MVEANTPGALYIDGPAQKLTIITTAIDLDFADYVKRTSDAHMIKAAPDMFEVIDDLLNLADDSMVAEWFGREFVDKARAAYARAKGDAE